MTPLSEAFCLGIARRLNLLVTRTILVALVSFLAPVPAMSQVTAEASPTIYDRVMGALGDDLRAPGTNFMHRPGIRLKEAADPLMYERIGDGPTNVVVLAAMGIAGDAFHQAFESGPEGFSYFIVYPPGYGASPAYRWPSRPEDFSTLAWSEAFLSELEEFVKTQFESRPVLVSWGPEMNSLAIRFAARHGDRLEGLLVLGTTGRQGQSPFNRWYNADDSTLSEVPFDVAKQKETVLGGFIHMWRTVDEHMWWDNSYQASQLSNDAFAASRMLASQRMLPFNIFMRYFAESLLMDISEDVQSLEVKTIALLNVVSPENRVNDEVTIEKAQVDASRQKERIKKDWSTNANDVVEIRFIEDVGLAVWQDAPDEFFAALTSIAQD